MIVLRSTCALPVQAPLPNRERIKTQDGAVYVVDDDGPVRRSLERLVRSWGMSVESFPSAQAFLRGPHHPGPSCLVLDLCMPGLDGIALQEALSGTDAQIVFLSGHGDVPTCAHAMKAGAVDFLTKPVDEEKLNAAVVAALQRSAATRESAVARSAARKRRETLTHRELEVMQRVIAGMLNKQIAEDLGVAEKTVKIHRGRVMEKMGVTSVAKLVRIAQAAGILPVTAEMRA